jgi:hypothetical protein
MYDLYVIINHLAILLYMISFNIRTMMIRVHVPLTIYTNLSINLTLESEPTVIQTAECIQIVQVNTFSLCYYFIIYYLCN